MLRLHVTPRRRNREALLLEGGLAVELLDVLALFCLFYAAHPLGYFLQFIGALQVLGWITDLWIFGRADIKLTIHLLIVLDEVE